MNDKSKQLKLVDFIKFHRLDVIMLQEHNVHSMSKICKELLDICHIFLNLAVNLKGGTAILINKKLHHELICKEMSADSRLMSIKINLYKHVLHFIWSIAQKSTKISLINCNTDYF